MDPKGMHFHRADVIWSAIALALILPWMGCRLVGAAPGVTATVVIAGLSIVGAAFILSWASELAQLEIPTGLAVIVLALVAVLPEYAVDLYYAWDAGRVLATAPPGSHPVELGLPMANMTGANRLLLGMGWTMVVLFAWWRSRSTHIELDAATGALDISFLTAATMYSFVIPLKGTLSLIDALFFIGLFGLYARRAARGAVGPAELEGVPLALSGLPRRPRRLVTVGMFIFAGIGVFLAAEPFAEGLKHLGEQMGLDTFLLVQWLAPLASESPEFIVAALLALKGNARMGLSALVSSKVNQWTLLVGMIPIAVAAASNGHLALPLDERQKTELLLTSAQSAFAVVLIGDLRLSVAEALALAALFFTQLLMPASHHAFIGVYFALTAALLLFRPHLARTLAGHLRTCLRP